MRNRVWVNARGNQARNVRHVDEQVSTDAVCDFTHFAQSTIPGVSREATDDHLRFMLLSLLRHVCVVNFTGPIDTVRNDVVQFAGEVQPGSRESG